MDSMTILVIAVVIVVGIGIGIGVIVIFNTLIAKRQMAHNGWSDIDVQLKRRADLIPQLVSTVQGYAAHERALFADIAKKRSAALAAGDDPAKRGAAESELSQPVGRLLAVAESYPDLKASGNFLELQRQLADTEDKIEMARRFYNGAVRELNTSVETFPANVVAGLFGVGKRSYFEITNEADRTLPHVTAGIGQ
jgi:LemA protein